MATVEFIQSDLTREHALSIATAVQIVRLITEQKTMRCTTAVNKCHTTAVVFLRNVIVLRNWNKLTHISHLIANILTPNPQVFVISR